MEHLYKIPTPSQPNYKNQKAEMEKKVESMQKYIEVLEENLELHNNLPIHVKRLMTENEDLKAEIKKIKDAQEIATVKTSYDITPVYEILIKSVSPFRDYRPEVIFLFLVTVTLTRLTPNARTI